MHFGRAPAEPTSQRCETVEHPFGTMKVRIGATHFPTNTLPKVVAEIALSVLAYNLTRVMDVIGTKSLMAEIVAETEPVVTPSRLPWEGCFYTAKIRVSKLPPTRTVGVKVSKARIRAKETKFARHFKGLISIGNVRVRSSIGPLSAHRLSRLSTLVRFQPHCRATSEIVVSIRPSGCVRQHLQGEPTRQRLQFRR
jgi:hypothetical protein